MSFRYIIIAFALLLFVSCEERPVVIPDFVPPETDKVVLIEEMTGVRCPGCPAGALEIKRLQGVFGENLVAVSYYTDFLGFPLPESKFDFRNDDARTVEGRLGVYTAKPASTFNRELQDDVTRFNTVQGEWGRQVEERLVDFTPVLISGKSSYDSTANLLNVEITISPKAVFSGFHNLTVLLTESHIEDAQLHPGNDVVEDYEHNHVFRKLLTDVTGTTLPETVASPNQLIYTFSTSLEEEWVPENIEVVAFIEEQEDGSPKEVIQAFQMHLIQ